MEVIISYIVTAFFTSSMGSLVRIAHENDVQKTTLKKGLLVYICSMSTGYVCYEAAVYYSESWIVGVPPLILALGAVEITRAFKNSLGFIVEKILKGLPAIALNAIRMAVNVPREEAKKAKPENEDRYRNVEQVDDSTPEFNAEDYE